MTSTEPNFRHNRVRHKQGLNTITYRKRCSGMREQFDISGVFETTEFEIAKVACIKKNGLLVLQTTEKQYAIQY